VIEFLSYPFFQRALVAGALVAILCGALSFFVVLRRLAFVGSGIAHAAFGGVALATLAGLPPGVGGLIVSLAVAGATARASDSSGVTEDTTVGVFTVAAMAAGVVALGFVKTNVDLFGLMFGNILTVDPTDLVILGAATLGILVSLVFFFRPLLLASVDEEGARVAGVATGAMRLLVLVLIAVAVVVALKVVGILLVSALLILPGATVRPLVARWPAFLTGSIAVAFVSVVGGLFLSVSLDIASGAAIILLGAILFVAALLVARFRLRSA
jgi:zinc transport system permease protein